MKHLKMLAAVFAICLGFGLSTDAKFFANYSWFSYLGGNTRVPSNYYPIPTDPACTGANLCAINVLVGANNRPDQTSLNRLYNESTHFSVAAFLWTASWN